MKLYFLIICIVFTNALFSQQLLLKDIVTEDPIEGVAVYLKGTSKGVSSDKNGFVDLSVFKKTDTLFIQHLAYQTGILVKIDAVGIYYLRSINHQLEMLTISTPKDEILNRKYEVRKWAVKNHSIEAVALRLWDKVFKDIFPDPPQTEDLDIIGPIGEFWRTWHYKIESKTKPETGPQT